MNPVEFARATRNRGAVARILLLLALCLAPRLLRAQDNYEIQIYPAETVAPGATMVELHSNFTGGGTLETERGVLPTNHQMHETLEITHGFNSWFEVGYYVFTSVRSDQGWDFVGTHIRPRVRVPDSWHWPVGVSISQEFGYQRRNFSEDTWSYELRPIVDQTIGRWYWAVNPAFERAVVGPNTGTGFTFSPGAQVAFDVTRKAQLALEYYGDLGPIRGFVPRREQGHQIFPAVNLDFGPNWEFNAGFGIGLTHGTDHLILKTIVGYRFHHAAGGQS